MSTAEEVSMVFSERVRQLRVHRRMTQAALATQAGVTVETVARIERVIRQRDSANSNPSLSTIAALAEALGVEITDLFKLTRPKKVALDYRVGQLIEGVTPTRRATILKIVETLAAEE